MRYHQEMNKINTNYKKWTMNLNKQKRRMTNNNR